ncbi:MAG: zinc ribbon domain-containing protein [bacterium]
MANPIPPPPDARPAGDRSGTGAADTRGVAPGAAPEIEGLAEHSCPACGAAAEWSPGKNALVCPYCGTESPLELDTDTGKIREIPLAQALREIPESVRGWKAEKRSVRCKSCRAISVFDPEQVGKNCAFCGSPELVDYEEIRSPLRPQSVLPFRVDEARVRETIRKWWKSKWLAPGTLEKRSNVDRLKGVYLPYWTFDASVSARWTADSGTYYYTTRTVRGADGRTQQVQERHVRWTPAAGNVQHAFDDELVPASQGIHPGLLRAVEPFPTGDLLPYDTAYLSGFLVEHYQIVLVDAAAKGRAQMEEQLRAMCAAQVPGDTYRNLRVDANWGSETFKHILAPVWLLTYDYGPKAFQVVVNGVTGRMAGEYPKSGWKIFFLVLLGIVAVALLALIAQQG